MKHCSKRRNTLLTVAICALVAGCSSTRYRWEPPEGLDAEAQKSAWRDCRQLAEQEPLIAFYPLSFGFKPYAPYPRYRAPWLDPYHSGYVDLYQQRRSLLRVCMKAKGWRRVAEPASSENSGQPGPE